MKTLPKEARRGWLLFCLLILQTQTLSLLLQNSEIKFVHPSQRTTVLLKEPEDSDLIPKTQNERELTNIANIQKKTQLEARSSQLQTHKLENTQIKNNNMAITGNISLDSKEDKVITGGDVRGGGVIQKLKEQINNERQRNLRAIDTDLGDEIRRADHSGVQGTFRNTEAETIDDDIEKVYDEAKEELDGDLNDEEKEIEEEKKGLGVGLNEELENDLKRTFRDRSEITEHLSQTQREEAEEASHLLEPGQTRQEPSPQEASTPQETTDNETQNGTVSEASPVLDQDSLIKEVTLELEEKHRQENITEIERERERIDGEKEEGLETDEEIEEVLDDNQDKELEKEDQIISEDMDASPIPEANKGSEDSSKEDLSQLDDEERSAEAQDHEIEVFGEDESPTSTGDDVEEIDDESETASQKTKEMINGNADFQEIEDDIMDSLEPTQKIKLHEQIQKAAEEARLRSPNSKTVVIVIGKNNGAKEVKNIRFDDLEDEYPVKSTEEGGDFSDSQTETETPSPNNLSYTEKEGHQQLLNAKADVNNIIENGVSDAEEIPSHHSNTPSSHEKNYFSNSDDFKEFAENPIKNQILPKRIHKSQNETQQEHKADQKINQMYVQEEPTSNEVLRLFAEQDSLKRATEKVPIGMPTNLYLSDLVGVSGVGKYMPSTNMIKYYGRQSGFQGHFANKAGNQVSFDDIDTLSGLLSDIHGIFTTIYDLMPSKKEVDTTEYQAEKGFLDKTYDVLKFYARLRGFIHTLVYNRHLIVQDIHFLKGKVENLNSGHEDMLEFYGLSYEYAKMRSRAATFSEDDKVGAHIKKVHEVAFDFEKDVRTSLKSLFTLEKAIIFFDNDARQLAQGINTNNPLQALKTVDRVILFVIRLLEVKIDLFKSIYGMKDSLTNLKRYKDTLTVELGEANKLLHYYELVGKGVGVISIGKIWGLLMVAFCLVSGLDNAW